MNLKTSPFSILNKDRREMEYIKEVYKRRVQAEIDSYEDSDDEDKRDTIQAQDILMIDKIAIWIFNFSNFKQLSIIYLLILTNLLITWKEFRNKENFMSGDYEILEINKQIFHIKKDQKKIKDCWMN